MFKAAFKLCLSLLLALPALAPALALSSGTDQFARACDVVTWSDASGQPRSVWIVKGTPGAFIAKMTYYAGPSLVTAQAPTNTFAFCTLVNHHTDNFGGAFTSSVGCNPPSIQPGGTTYRVGVTPSIAFNGAHHLIWRGSLQMYVTPWSGTNAWWITVQYIFTDGRDDFIFSNAYDSGEMLESNMNSTNLAPYSDFDFDGDGGTGEGQTGISVGTKYKFRTNDSAGSLNINSGWTYMQANTIPFAWMYKDTTKNDRELGVVQNQPYTEKDAGYGGYDPTQFPLPPTASTGQRLPNLADGTAFRLPFQMNVYADYAGQRFTWGTTYDTFRNTHTDGLGTSSSWDNYPINASSFSVLIDRYSDNGLPKLLSDTENIYASSLTASLGSVVTSGPKGPGNYVSAVTGAMPTRTYSHPGFDFVTRAWRFNTHASGNAVMILNAGGALSHPTFILNSFPQASPCRVRIDGVDQVAGTDYEASYDASAQQLYLSLLKTLAPGSRTIEADSSCGTPTPSYTPCPACSPTSSATPTIVLTSTPTYTPTLSWTPTPPCSGGAFDDFEDNNATDLWGGPWSNYNPGGGTTMSPAAFSPSAPGYASSYCGRATGTVSGTNYPSISAFLAGSTGGVNACAYAGLSFWFKGDAGKAFQVQIHSAIQDTPTVSYNDYKYGFTGTGAWQQLTLLYSQFSWPGYGPNYAFSCSDMRYITWLPLAAGSYDMSIDNVAFFCPAATPTSSVSATLTPSRSATPTATRTSSFTMSPTLVPAGSSPTMTPTFSRSPTPLTGLPSCPVLSMGSFLMPNDKILFFGDSITYRGNYTNAVQSYLTKRYPAANFTFVNSGVPGDAASNGVFRLNTTVLNYNPNVVLICFGMNDPFFGAGSYQSEFSSNMTTIITNLQSAGIRVALLTPGYVDTNAPDAPAVLPAGMNAMLQWEATWVINYGAAHSIPVYDIHTDMANADAAAKAGIPNYIMIPDSIHPDPAGGLIMAYGALRALGVPDSCGEINFNAASDAVLSSAPLAASNGSGSGSSWGFDVVLNAQPFVPPTAARKIYPYLPTQNQLNHLGLTVSNLPVGNYYVVVDGHRSGPVTQAALATGINLMDHWQFSSSDPSHVYHVDLVDASSQPAYLCDSALSDGLIDDFEHPKLVNLWGGDLWALDAGAGASTASPNPLSFTAGGYFSTTCLHLSGNADLNSPGRPPAVVCYLNSTASEDKQGVRFYFKGTAGAQVRMQIHSWYEKRQVPEIWNDYGFTFTGTGAWTQVSIPFSSLGLPSWGLTPFYTFDPQGIVDLVWVPMTQGAFDFSLDNIEFYCTGTPPSPTPSSTPANSFTATPSSTATATSSLTPSWTPTATPSLTATLTASKSATLSASPSPSSTATPSVTTTHTPPPPGSTLTHTPTISPTFTSSPTATASVTASFSESPTPSLTPTASATASPTVSATSSATVSPSSSASPTRSATRTASLTATVTSTSTALPAGASPTSTRSSTPSSTPTGTSAPSGSGWATPMPSEGPLSISEILPSPNPNPGALMLKLDGPAERCKVLIYSKSMVKLAEYGGPGRNSPGWVSLSISTRELSNGTYYVVALAERGERRSEKGSIGKILILR